jgi:hypothetical protein
MHRRVSLTPPATPTCGKIADPPPAGSLPTLVSVQSTGDGETTMPSQKSRIAADDVGWSADVDVLISEGDAAVFFR